MDHEKFDFSGKIWKSCGSTTPIMASPAILTGSNFSGVDTKNIVFVRSDYNESIINLVDVDFSFADLSFHDLSNADLSCFNHQICNNQ